MKKPNKVSRSVRKVLDEMIDDQNARELFGKNKTGSY